MHIIARPFAIIYCTKIWRVLCVFFTPLIAVTQGIFRIENLHIVEPYTSKSAVWVEVVFHIEETAAAINADSIFTLPDFQRILAFVEMLGGGVSEHKGISFGNGVLRIPSFPNRKMGSVLSDVFTRVIVFKGTCVNK